MGAGETGVKMVIREGIGMSLKSAKTARGQEIWNENADDKVQNVGWFASV